MKLSDFNVPTSAKVMPISFDSVVIESKQSQIKSPIRESTLAPPIYGLEESDSRIVERWKKISPEVYTRLINWD